MYSAALYFNLILTCEPRMKYAFVSLLNIRNVPVSNVLVMSILNTFTLICLKPDYSLC